MFHSMGMEKVNFSKVSDLIKESQDKDTLPKDMLLAVISAAKSILESRSYDETLETKRKTFDRALEVCKIEPSNEEYVRLQNKYCQLIDETVVILKDARDPARKQIGLGYTRSAERANGRLSRTTNRSMDASSGEWKKDTSREPPKDNSEQRKEWLKKKSQERIAAALSKLSSFSNRKESSENLDEILTKYKPAKNDYSGVMSYYKKLKNKEDRGDERRAKNYGNAAFLQTAVKGAAQARRVAKKKSVAEETLGEGSGGQARLVRKSFSQSKKGLSNKDTRTQQAAKELSSDMRFNYKNPGKSYAKDKPGSYTKVTKWHTMRHA